MTFGLLLLVVALPGAGGAALALAGRRADRIAAPLAIGAAVAVLAAAVLIAVLGAPGVDVLTPDLVLGIGVDRLSAVLLVAVAGVAVLVLAFAAVQGQTPAARFHGLMLLFLGAVALTLLATTLPVLLAAWEVMGAVSAALIGLAWRDPAAVGGGVTAFVTTRIADLGLYLAAGAAVAGGGTLDLGDLAASRWHDVVAAGVIVAALGKAAQLPFSFWLSRAMAGPTAVSALLHSAALVAMGGYLLLRMHPLLAATGWAGPVVAALGAATAIVLGVVALAQRDLKQALAASTAAQLGFVVLAAGLGATAGGTAQVLAHAATKALLFLVAAVWIAGAGTTVLADLRGAARRAPAAGVLFTIGAASLAGLPPLSIWAAKDLILASAAASPALLAAALAAEVLAAAYSARLLRVVWSRAAGPGVDGAPAPQGPRRAAPLVPIVVLSAFAAGLGALAVPAVRAVLPASAPASSLPLLGATAALVVAGFLLDLLRDLPAPALAERWFDLEALAHAVVVRPVLVAAARAAAADDALVRAVSRIGALTRRAAVAAASADTALARAAAGAGPARRVGDGGTGAAHASIAGAGAALGRLALSPQTGRLWQYLAAGVLGVAALTILLVVVR